MATTGSMTSTFRLHVLFPPDDPASVPLLRLMAATNDARHTRRLILDAFDAHDRAIGTSERLVRDGELGYLQRMFCGHLYEAGKAFRGLQPERLDVLMQGNPAGAAALARVRSVYLEEGATAFYHQILGPIRTLAAFHYKEERFRGVLAGAGGENATVVVCEMSGLSRHTVTDSFATRFLIDLCGGTGEDLGEQLARAVALGGDLEVMVDHVLAKLLDTRPGAVTAVERDEVTVPGAYERLRAERGI